MSPVGPVAARKPSERPLAVPSRSGPPTRPATEGWPAASKGTAAAPSTPGGPRWRTPRWPARLARQDRVLVAVEGDGQGVVLHRGAELPHPHLVPGGIELDDEPVVVADVGLARQGGPGAADDVGVAGPIDPHRRRTLRTAA